MSLQVHQPTHDQLHRLPSSSCHLHPDELVTGFCASCLRERLADLDTAAAASSSSTRKSTSSSAFKSLLFKAAGGGPPTSSNSTSSSFLRPELRRCKSFSCGRGDGFAGPRASAAFEPQRKSCDVRVRNTLWSLFHQDDKNRHRDVVLPSAAAAPAGGQIEVECLSASVAAPVLETREEDEAEEEKQQEEEQGRDNEDEITIMDPVLVVGTSGEIEEGVREEEAELKPMKDHIDLDSGAQAKKPPPKDLKEIAGSFWLAASVFSKKLQKWRGKQKLKKQQAGSKAAASAMPPPGKPHPPSRRFRDTQSEVAVDAFGRRSCDIDPRFSLDAGRISFDDPRFSWDEPRASWDGYLVGGRSVFHRLPPMLSVVEDAPVPAVERSDSQIPVEEDAVPPGGSIQTRDYYSDTSGRRRWSFERSNSVRKVTVETNEPKPASDAKVSPGSGTEFFPFQPGSLLDRDILRGFSSNSLREDRSESFESAFGEPYKGSCTKKPRRWGKAWNIWGLINRRGGSRGGGGVVVDRSLSESWPELRARGCSGRILRCNSSASSRSSLGGNGGIGSMSRSGMGKKRREEIVLERNRSDRFSPTHFDIGSLRWRDGGWGKGRNINSHHWATRSTLGSY
ncbi:protein OCTOPUS-like [Phoenix dactylifera]|uniref:Protein OCTOPUS-like n=1 Tax=Phoenix dactylifera TaxID=42345 RepID=A0A8B8IYZ5_PHODC|nr:protein OCTOPUS-like [Phoenix dactylifera]XP_038980061.1 protein OCTOPUS-like [Phoenix dactylifera]